MNAFFPIQITPVSRTRHGFATKFEIQSQSGLTGRYDKTVTQG